MEHMSDFLIKGAIIVFGFVPLGLSIATLMACFLFESAKAACEQEREGHGEER